MVGHGLHQSRALRTCLRGQPADVAPMVRLLASDEGSWITGQVISISGGFSMV